MREIHFRGEIAKVTPAAAYTSQPIDHSDDSYLRASANLYVRRGRVRMEVIADGIVAGSATSTAGDERVQLIIEGVSAPQAPVSLFVHAASPDCDAEIIAISLAPQ